MKFFKAKDLLKSWSVWAAGLVTVTPLIDMNSDLFAFVPTEYKPLVVTGLGLITLIARAVVQVNTTFSTSSK